MFKCSYLGNKAHLAQVRFFRLSKSLPYSGFFMGVIFTTSSKGEIELWYLFLVGRRWFFLLWWSCFVLKKKRVYKFCISSTVQRSFRFFSFCIVFYLAKASQEENIQVIEKAQEKMAVIKTPPVKNFSSRLTHCKLT